MNPFTSFVFAWQSGLVFALRSMELWTKPDEAQTRLTAYAMEKQRAFTAGAMAAGRAAMAGSDGMVVLEAAMRPSQRRVKVNAQKLLRG